MAELMLASDGEREACAVRLRDAAAEGRLDVAELEERLAAAYAARTQQDLHALTADLPQQLAAPHPKQRAPRPRGHLSQVRRRLVAAGAAGNAALMGLWLADVGPTRDPVIFGITHFDVPWPLIPLAAVASVAAVAAWRRGRGEAATSAAELTA
jgi:hypothetical protein